MNHLFATYELSLLAKEKGFKDFCFAGYVEINTKEFQFMMNSQIDSIDEAIGLGDNLITKAPLYQQLVDWFFEKHKISIEAIMYIPQSGENDGCYVFIPIVSNSQDYKHNIVFKDGMYSSRNKALTKAIQEAFKLI